MNPETIIAELRAEIAQLKGALALGQENCDAEYEELRRERDIARDGLRDSHIRAEQLEARVAELDAELKWWKLEVRTPKAIEDALNWIAAEGQKHDDTFDYSRFMELIGEFKVHHRAAESDRMKLRAANAELEAALRSAVNELERQTTYSDGMPSVSHNLKYNLRATLASAESATPAKHPDTERLDWLEGAPSERLAEVRRILWQQRNTCEATRAAIDAARKEVQP